MNASRSIVQNPPSNGIIAIESFASTGATETPGVFYDSNITTFVAEDVSNRFQLYPKVLDGPVVFTSETPGIATVSSEGLVEPVANGIAKIRSVFESGLSVLSRLAMKSSDGAEYTEFTGYVEGSTSDILADALTSRMIAGKETEVFSTANHTTKTYVLNPNCWTYGLDLSGIPVWVSWGLQGEANRGGLITPQHLACCVHYPQKFYTTMVGKTFRFLGKSGAIHERTVIGIRNYADIQLCVFDSPLTNDVTPLAIPGDWFIKGLTATPGYVNVADFYVGGVCLWQDQWRRNWALPIGLGNYKIRQGVPLIETLNGISYTNVTTGHYENIAIADAIMGNGVRTFFKQGVSGDSGAAAVSIINNVPSLVLVYGGGSGPVDNNGGLFLQANLTALDASVGVITGHTITVAPDPTPS